MEIVCKSAGNPPNCLPRRGLSIYSFLNLGVYPIFKSELMSGDKSKEIAPKTVLAGRYELSEQIGRGGFGEVYRARQLNMDRDVAIKILPPRFMMIPDVVERFKREAKLASRLRHPNTITLHDWGQEENLLFIVMELLKGEDLADLLKREGRLPQDRVMIIARQVLKSLSEAHDEGIVHRDLKPENIFLSVMGDDHDVVKVLDFGIAKLAIPEASKEDNHRSLTMSGSTVGTPTYMSPEQAAGEEVDQTTDLYALGIIMYEMLNGRPPFHYKDPVRVMRAQLFDVVPPFRDDALNGTLIDRIIRKTLAKERSDRFKSANQLLLALAGEPAARPIVKGLNMSALGGAPSESFDAGPDTEEMELGDADSDRFAQTLQFSDAIQLPPEEEDEDAIPFGDLDKAPRDKEVVRSSLIEQSGGKAPESIPMNPASISSILTVIAPPAPSDEEIIILTTPKLANDSGARVPAQRMETGDHMTAAPAAEDATNDLNTGERNWSWGEEVVTGSHDSQRRRGARWPIVLVVLLLVSGALLAGLYFTGNLAL